MIVSMSETEVKLFKANERIAELEAENNRLRKELASWRKGECRRRIDRAMEPVVLDEISRKAAKELTGEAIRKKVDAAMEGE